MRFENALNLATALATHGDARQIEAGERKGYNKEGTSVMSDDRCGKSQLKLRRNVYVREEGTLNFIWRIMMGE